MPFIDLTNFQYNVIYNCIFSVNGDSLSLIIRRLTMKQDERFKTCFGNCKKKVKQDARAKDMSVPNIALYGEKRTKIFKAEQEFALKTNVSEIGLLVVRKTRTTKEISSKENGKEEKYHKE